MFLMHRVELKAEDFLAGVDLAIVPNAPCGVERRVRKQPFVYLPSFLMHRVELKGGSAQWNVVCGGRFLMHRVELKENSR